MVSFIGTLVAFVGLLLLPRRGWSKSHGDHGEAPGGADGHGDGGLAADCAREDDAKRGNREAGAKANPNGGARLRRLVGIVLLALGALALIRTVVAFLGYRPVGIHQTFEGYHFDGLMLGISAMLIIAGGLFTFHD